MERGFWVILVAFWAYDGLVPGQLGANIYTYIYLLIDTHSKICVYIFILSIWLTWYAGQLSRTTAE